MKIISLNIENGADFEAAETAARQAAARVGGNVTLVSYYDRIRDRIVPQTSSICMGKAGYRVYAERRGCDIRVIVNDGAYDFYFYRIPCDVLEPTEHHSAFADAHRRS